MPSAMLLSTFLSDLSYPLWALGLCLLAGCAWFRTPDAPLSIPPDFDVQGHRGARGLLPENTIPAFIRALELGVTTLELDVVIAADGEVVVSHDPFMRRALCLAPDGSRIRSEKKHVIYQMPYETIARYDCGALRLRQFSRQQSVPGTPKPRLREVIATAEAWAVAHSRPRPRYNVETKSRPSGDGVLHPGPEDFTRRVLDVFRETGVLERSTLQSFDVRTLQVARRLEPSLTLSLLVNNGRGVEGNLKRLGFVPAIYSPNHRLVTAALVEAVHARGMKLLPWTVNDPARMRRLIRLGADGLITDYPDVLMQGVKGQ